MSGGGKESLARGLSSAITTSSPPGTSSSLLWLKGARVCESIRTHAQFQTNTAGPTHFYSQFDT